jgi:predicted  nucleic acid-binding Zn-ribbon protein
MASEELLISGIEYKIRKLITLNEALKDENESLKQEVNFLKNKIEELTESLQKAENRIVKLSLANTLEYNIGVEKGKDKLEELIEEIDRCIDVLSD